jgi:hypothetical protein
MNRKLGEVLECHLLKLLRKPLRCECHTDWELSACRSCAPFPSRLYLVDALGFLYDTPVIYSCVRNGIYADLRYGSE